MKGYLGRRIAEAVSGHTVAPLPPPTPDVLASTIFSATVTHADGLTIRRRYVLALTEPQARHQVRLWLLDVGDAPEQYAVAVMACTWDGDLARSILQNEARTEATYRSTRWALGQQAIAQGDGDPGDDDPGDCAP